MMVVVTTNVPPRLRGRLAVWLLEVRAGVYIGHYSVKTRSMVQDTVRDLIGDGDAVVAWASPNDAGFEFETFGANRRIPVEFDGLRLVSFLPIETGEAPGGERPEIGGAADVK